VDDHRYQVPRSIRAVLPSAGTRSSPAALHAVGVKLGAQLRAAAYTEPELHRLIGRSPRFALAPGDRYAITARLDRSGQAVAARMFLMGESVQIAAAEAVFGRQLIQAMLRCRLLRRARLGGVRSRLCVLPYGGVLVAGDFALPRLSRAALPPYSPSSVTLAALLPRERVGSMLDLGTGSGFQAVLASAHANSVLGMDNNPRSALFAALTAGLNGVPSFAVRLGDWLEPLADDERFDLVAANLPFVVAPHGSAYATEQGHPNELTQRLLTALPHRIKQDGTATVLCSWVDSGQGDWSLGFPGAEGPIGGVDLAILPLAQQDVVAYASEQNDWLRRTNGRRFRAAFQEWLRYYERCGVRRITEAAVVMRARADSRNISICCPPVSQAGHGAAAQVGRVLDSVRVGHLREASAAAVKIRLAPRVLISCLQDARQRHREIRVFDQDGLGWAVEVDLATVDALCGFPGGSAVSSFVKRGQASGMDADTLIGDLMRLGHAGLLETVSVAEGRHERPQLALSERRV
jgi:hypothetical protein